MHLTLTLAASLLTSGASAATVTRAAPSGPEAPGTPAPTWPQPTLAVPERAFDAATTRRWFDAPSASLPSEPGGTYLRLTGGLVTTEDSGSADEDIEFDEGYLLSIGLGQRVGALSSGPGFGVELDGVFTDEQADDRGVIQAVDDVRVAGALVNGILDFRVVDRLSFYGGGGLGAAWLDVDTSGGFEDEDGPFLAWQLKTGAAWRFAPSTRLHLGYRMLNIDDAEIDDGVGGVSFDLETQQHVLEAGLLFGY